MNSFGIPPADCREAHHVLALVALRGDDVFASGSAVLVGPNVALTARHVTDDFSCHFHGSAPDTNARADYQIMARGFYAGAWRTFHVHQTFNTAGTDITALYLSLADGESTDFEWPRITLDLFPPRRSRRVWSWGHVTPSAFITDSATGSMRWYGQLCKSSGVVQEIFPRMRDSGFIHYPAFQFNARVDHSMSGGPIFDEDGHLVGINSTSLNPSDEHPEHVSTGSLLWPVPALPFTALSEVVSSSMVTFLEDLRVAGRVNMLNHQHVRVDRSVSPGELLVNVTIPEDRC